MLWGWLLQIHTSAAASPAVLLCCLASALASSAVLDSFRRFFLGFSSLTWLAAAHTGRHRLSVNTRFSLCLYHATLHGKFMAPRRASAALTFADVQAAKGQVGGGRGGGGGRPLGRRLLPAAERLIHLRQLPAEPKMSH